MSDSATPWTTARQASLSITNSRSSPKLMSIESVMPSNHLIVYHPLLLLLSVFPSIRVFSNESALCIRWPKYWSVSFNISPSNEHQGLISFRMNWLDLLAVQGTLKSLLQHHSSKASILQGSVFFTVQLPHPCMTTGKIIALTRQTFVGKVMFLLFNMLSKLVINIIIWKGKTKPQSCKSPLSHKIYSLLSCSWLQVKMYIVEINEYVMLHITYIFPLACIFKDLFHISTWSLNVSVSMEFCL